MRYSIMIKDNITDEILINEETSCIIGALSAGDDYTNRIVLTDTDVPIIKNCIVQAQRAVNHAINLVKGRKMTIKEFFKSGENLAIHCDTEEKATKLLESFDEADYYWLNGKRYKGCSLWHIHKENTCYSNHGMLSSIDFYRETKYRILEFEEIEFENTPEKQEEEK